MKNQLSNEEIRNFCLSLSVLIHAGISTADGLALMAEDESGTEREPVLLALTEQVDAGRPLSSAAEESGVFPRHVTGMLAAGEETGRLEEALNGLAEYYDSRFHMERQLRTALLYPTVLLLIMLAVIVILLVKVLPMFDQVYGQLGSRLTGIAGGLLLLGQVLGKAMPFLCLAVGVCAALVIGFSLRSDFRRAVIKKWQKHFGGSGVSGSINTAAVAQIMAMAMRSGLPAEKAMELAADMMTDVPAVRGRCQACAAALQAGLPLARAAGQHGVLPRSGCRLLEAGIRGGSGDSVMREIARQLQEESEELLAARVSQAEPAMVLAASVLIGLILLSVMLPLVHIMSAIG